MRLKKIMLNLLGLAISGSIGILEAMEEIVNRQYEQEEEENDKHN